MTMKMVNRVVSNFLKDPRLSDLMKPHFTAMR
jgi:hypothetical protein